MDLTWLSEKRMEDPDGGIIGCSTAQESQCINAAKSCYGMEATSSFCSSGYMVRSIILNFVVHMKLM